LFKRLIPVEEAQGMLLKETKEIGDIEYVDIDNCFGRVVAEDIFALIDVPSFDRATRDGFAVRASDIVYASEKNPAKLVIRGYVRAGQKAGVYIGNGYAVRIDTGAMIPPGAEAVVPIEYCSIEEGSVLIFRRVAFGENIQWAGGDLKKGELLVQRGTMLDVKHIGALSACGYTRIPVKVRPKVAIFSIGNELVNVGERVDYGRIYDINIHTINALVRDAGGEPLILGIASDSLESIMEKIEHAIKTADLIVSSGGSSVGVSDLIRKVVEELNARILFHGVMSKPGKPVLAAKISEKLYIGLPGNPTSAIISFMLYVRPVIHKMLGCKIWSRVSEYVRLLTREYPVRGRRLYKTITLKSRDGQTVYEPLRPESESIATMLKSDAFFIVPEDVEYLDEGTRVRIWTMDRFIQYPDVLIVGDFSPTILRIILNTANRVGVRVRYVRKNNEGAKLSIKNGVADIAILTETEEYDAAIQRRIVLVKRREKIKSIATACSLNFEKSNIVRVGTHQSAIFRLRNGYVDAAIVPLEIAELYELENVIIEDYGSENIYVVVGGKTPRREKFLEAISKVSLDS